MDPEPFSRFEMFESSECRCEVPEFRREKDAKEEREANDDQDEVEKAGSSSAAGEDERLTASSAAPALLLLSSLVPVPVSLALELARRGPRAK